MLALETVDSNALAILLIALERSLFKTRLIKAASCLLKSFEVILAIKAEIKSNFWFLLLLGDAIKVFVFLSAIITVAAAKKYGVPESQMMLVEGEVGILAAMKAGRADVAVQTFFGAKEHEAKSNGMFEVTDPKLMPKETLNVVGIGFRKSDVEFRDNFNAALAKVMSNPAKMLERAGEYGYDKAQLPPPSMSTEWACSTK